MASLPNWLDGNRIPAELKLIILEHISSHSDLVSLLQVYPWVNELWDQYPRPLFRRALDNVFEDIDPELKAQVLFVYQIRKTRNDYNIAIGSSDETQSQRDGLQAELREILNPSNPGWIMVDECLQTILDIGDIIRDVNSLTYRYSNDAWNRIRNIAEQTMKRPYYFPKPENPPPINLTRRERLSFNRAFLKVEIYLLTKYWTDAQDQRHILDMGQDIDAHIPPYHGNIKRRNQFDCCLRYIFHAYRGHLKDTAREIGAPEFPRRDDLQWVPNWFEGKSYQYSDYPTAEHVDPEMAFRHRSISEEQQFLLWLCEFGIGPLEQTHRADNSTRRNELIAQFSRRQIWETVELRHRVSRYDILMDQRHDPYKPIWPSHPDQHRNRHPIMSLFGHDSPLGYYPHYTPAWACASEFLGWDFIFRRHKWWREGITLGRHGRWITLGDTDRGACAHNPFQTKGMLGYRAVPHGHPYMLDFEKYKLRWMPHGAYV